MTVAKPQLKLDAPFKGFTIMRDCEFLAKNIRIPDTSGVYALFLQDASSLLSSSGYDIKRHGEPAQVDGYTHLYTGESCGVRSRVGQHLRGTMLDSNLRETLLSIQQAYTVIKDAPDIAADLEAAEMWLTRWLTGRVMVAFRFGGYGLEIEGEILRATPSPLNIMGRSGSEYAQILQVARQSFKSRPEVIDGRRALAAKRRAQGVVNRHRRH